MWSLILVHRSLTAALYSRTFLIMNCFTRTERTMNGHYVRAPGRCFGAVVEMRPLWLDETTLQVALSDHDSWNDWYSHATKARLVNVRETVPDLREALRWCAERRFGTRVVCVAGSMNDRLAQTLRDWQANHGGSNPADVMLAPGRRFASHQLKFRTWQRAFEFRMRWC
jgi:hypothetical protein